MSKDIAPQAYTVDDAVWVNDHGRRLPGRYIRSREISGNSDEPHICFYYDDNLYDVSGFADADVSPRNPEPAADHIVDANKMVEPATNNHYQADDVQAIDIVAKVFRPEEVRAWGKIAAFLYLWRDRKKANTDDLTKAHWHLAQAIEARKSDSTVTLSFAPEEKDVLIDALLNPHPTFDAMPAIRDRFRQLYKRVQSALEPAEETHA